MTRPQDPNYQDQGALDQPQQGTDPAPGSYQTPGVVPPDQQTPAPELPDSTEQVPGGGAVETEETAPAATTPTPVTSTTTTTSTPPAAPAPAAPAAPKPSGNDS